MEDPEDDLFSFSSIEIPTVLGLLRNVLNQYPDNGQILKELVQNAEDAEASTFEVIYDTRAFRSTNEILGRFTQSPSLLVYNNAEFSKEDWSGIRMLSKSLKRKDPLKVGQFGLGFKSVFHFTDYITIISGGNVLFMDPSEPENRMCREIPLKKLRDCLSVEECLQLWGSHLNRDHIESGHISGTIFWFPLRKQESELSATIYRQSNVESLFTSFEVEASLCLTFLKCLENISIKVISENNVESDLFKVDLSSSSWKETQIKRRAFMERLKECQGISQEPLTCLYDMTVKTSKNGTAQYQQQYIVLHYLPIVKKHDVSTYNDEQSIQMPLVGIAAPMPPVEKDSRGHIFCFLPLPVESANNTSLPIQINGFFALDQNRRHVKWKTEESSNESDVTWNENLVSNEVVNAYFLLLEDVLKSTEDGDISANVWYSFLPNIESTNGRWKNLALKIWEKLVHLPVLRSEVRYQMMFPVDVKSEKSLDSVREPIKETIRKVAITLGVPLVTVPEHILTSLRLIGTELEELSPKIIRDNLKRNGIADEWDKLHLLEYVLSDKQYSDLQNLPLLPLKDGNWTSFQKHGKAVYICTIDEGKTLLGVENQLLKNDLPSEVLLVLREIANAEAKRWWKQAQHDINEALTQCGRSPCWTVYMCYKAAEKALKAVLYLDNCSLAQEIHQNSQSHDISCISSKISSEDFNTLVEEIKRDVGLYSEMQYPSHLGVPCDYYTKEHSSTMLQNTQILFQAIQRRF